MAPTFARPAVHHTRAAFPPHPEPESARVFAQRNARAPDAKPCPERRAGLTRFGEGISMSKLCTSHPLTMLVLIWTALVGVMWLMPS